MLLSISQLEQEIVFILLTINIYLLFQSLEAIIVESRTESESLSNFIRVTSVKSETAIETHITTE